MPFHRVSLAYHYFRGSAFLPSSKKAQGFRHVPEKAFPDRTSPLTDAPKTGLLVLRMGESFYTRTTEAPSSAFDLSLRPPAFSEFCGQEKIKDRLMLMVEAARQRDDVLDHILLSGPPGLGKTTLANIIANAVGCRIHTTSGPQIEKAGDLAGVLTNLEKGDILFIDEIHRLHPAIEEYLYPAMEDFRLDIIIDQGPNARSIQLNLPKFTLVGATTRAGMLTSPLRSRFGLVNRLDYYTREELCAIIERSAGLLNVPVDPEGALQIALRSRGTPRVANSLLRWVRDYAQVRGDGVITEQLAHDALTMIEIDDDGLDEMDKRLLEAMIYKFNGGPVGLSSLAVAVGEDASTLEDVHEPFLIMQGYISRTPRGRVAMPSAYLKMGAAPPANGQGWLL
jgi:Holliday junction DNA helicase RuvB